MNIPKAKFRIGDAVDVRIEEAGLPPTFRAVVCGIRFAASGTLDYTVAEESGAQSDGYTEEWLSFADDHEASRARRALEESIRGEVDRRIKAYFESEWMILRVPRYSVPEGAQLAECYQTAKEWIIMGQPSESDDHNCDEMGCGTLSHVLVRIPRLNV